MTRFSGVPDIQNLIDADGVPYGAFRKTLKLRQHRVYLNAVLAWFMIAAAVFVLVSFRSSPWMYLFILPGALWISFWLHAYTTHFHEAAHFNIHPDRKLNDLLSDIFLTPFTGMRVKDYRVSHWKHHLYLGLLEDTEVSYRSPIGIRQTVEGLTGVYLAKAVLRYFRNFRNIDESRKGGDSRSSSFVASLGLMLAFQGLITLLLWWYVSLPAGLTWAASIFVTSPFLAHLRQTLEHRALDADKGADYGRIVHGPVNRLFGTDFFSRNFGGAGFNRHLLHHYDPTVSYTCFDDLEAYFLKTPIATDLEKSRSTYWQAFMALARQ